MDWSLIGDGAGVIRTATRLDGMPLSGRRPCTTGRGGYIADGRCPSMEWLRGFRSRREVCALLRNPGWVKRGGVLSRRRPDGLANGAGQRCAQRPDGDCVRGGQAALRSMKPCCCTLTPKHHANSSFGRVHPGFASTDIDSVFIGSFLSSWRFIRIGGHA
jgi:hypothetical protein